MPHRPCEHFPQHPDSQPVEEKAYLKEMYISDFYLVG